MHPTYYLLPALLLGLLVACSDQTPDNKATTAPEPSSTSQASEVTLTAGGAAFESPSGISIQMFTDALGDFVGNRLRSAMTEIDTNRFRKGVQDGMQGAQEPSFSIEAMSSHLAKVEASQQGEEPHPYSPSAEEKPVISYAMGFIQGTQISQMGVYLDLDRFTDSFAASYANGSDNAEQSQKTISSYISELRQANQRESAAKSDLNLQKSKSFLTDNGAKAGIKMTDSGLQYEVLTKGDGQKPTASDTVQVHYSGTLLDGSEFDSSYKRNQPAVFPLNAVISGWTEGLQLMQVGDKYRFYIPPQLGYGERGSPPSIGPNELLIFEVELLGIL